MRSAEELAAHATLQLFQHDAVELVCPEGLLRACVLRVLMRLSAELLRLGTCIVRALRVLMGLSGRQRLPGGWCGILAAHSLPADATVAIDTLQSVVELG